VSKHQTLTKIASLYFIDHLKFQKYAMLDWTEAFVYIAKKVNPDIQSFDAAINLTDFSKRDVEFINRRIDMYGQVSNEEIARLLEERLSLEDPVL